MMLAYHFGMWPSFGHILEKAKQHDVGIVAMKTLKGAKHTNLANFRDEASAYSQAAFRWVLSNPNVSCLVVSFYEPQHVDEYLYASGTQPTASDVALLERYDQLTARRLLPAALRRLPELLPRAARDQRRPPLPHVLPRLRLGEGRHAAVREARHATRRAA